MGDAEGSIYGALDGVSLGLSFSEDEGSLFVSTIFLRAYVNGAPMQSQ